MHHVVLIMDACARQEDDLIKEILHFLGRGQHKLRMPLHREDILASFFCLESLNQPVGAPSDGLKRLRQFFDALMMERVDEMFLP